MCMHVKACGGQRPCQASSSIVFLILFYSGEKSLSLNLESSILLIRLASELQGSAGFFPICPGVVELSHCMGILSARIQIQVLTLVLQAFSQQSHLPCPQGALVGKAFLYLVVGEPTNQHSIGRKEALVTGSQVTWQLARWLLNATKGLLLDEKGKIHLQRPPGNLWQEVFPGEM